jgi:hypothetical protein
MRRVVFLFALLLLSSWCRSWGGEGHQLVALIAEEQLTPQAKAEESHLAAGVEVDRNAPSIRSDDDSLYLVFCLYFLSTHA